uniref:Uncharacterized protein n=2 Tax=Cacopsylla melanoneura TaxID=428564 RepID=A0A8D8STQ8_9HEMI
MKRQPQLKKLSWRKSQRRPNKQQENIFRKKRNKIMDKYILFYNQMAFRLLNLLLLAGFCTLNARADSDANFTRNVDYVKDVKEDVGVAYKIHERENENLPNTVEWIGRQLNITNPLKDVRKAYRSVVPKLDPRPIVIYFVNKTVRQHWLDAYAKKKRSIELWKPNYTDDSWVLTLLASGGHILVTETEDWADAKNYSDVWEHNDTIYYRKHANSPIYRIKHIEHLHHLHNATLEHRIEITAPPHGHYGLSDECQEEISDPTP